MGLQGIENDLLQQKKVYLVVSNKVADGKNLISKLENVMSKRHLESHLDP